MNRWLSSNYGAVIFSFFLAVGIVWIKGQERIDRRTLGNVPVNVDNLADNIILPESWLPPTASITVQGPKNTIELISQYAFHIDFSKVDIPKDGFPAIVSLRSDMFRTNLLNPNDRLRITVDEESILPSQVAIHFLEWDIDHPRPNYRDIPEVSNQLAIPVYRIIKNIPITVPYKGSLQTDMTLDSITVDPQSLPITGRREAIDRIKSVSTPFLDLSFIGDNPKPVILPLTNVEETYNIRLVDERIRHVTATVNIKKKGTN